MTTVTIPNWLTLKRFNDFLSLVIVVLALYIFLLPWAPQIGWWFAHSAPVVSTPVRRSIVLPAKGQPIPQDNRLVIPAMGLDEHIYEGQDVTTVNKGVWIRPNASTPDKGSNTVMVGHRFSYTAPRGPFYFLNKLQAGDQIVVYWQSRAYSYSVQTTTVVDPSDIAVEAPTSNNQLTLYTCTPLWSLKQRLVVVAKLERVTS